jgi:hypothetical protein
MRTTVTIDDDVIAAARSLSRQEGVSLGAALSKLARRGLAAPGGVGGASDQSSVLPSFEVLEAAPSFGNDDVRRALEDDETT